MMNLRNILHAFALTAADTAEKVSQDVNIDFSRLPDTLKHMGVGMLSIFVVIGVIIAVIYLLNKCMTRIEERKK